MTASKNAARVAVQAEPCPKQPVVVWAPCLLVQWHPMLGGISATCTKRLPGAFDTQREAMEAAEKVAHQHPGLGTAPNVWRCSHDC